MMKPSDFRKANPHLRGAQLAWAYALYRDPEAHQPSEAFDDWKGVLLGECKPKFIRADFARAESKK